MILLIIISSQSSSVIFPPIHNTCTLNMAAVWTLVSSQVTASCLPNWHIHHKQGLCDKCTTADSFLVGILFLCIQFLKLTKRNRERNK